SNASSTHQKHPPAKVATATRVSASGGVGCARAATMPAISASCASSQRRTGVRSGMAERPIWSFLSQGSCRALAHAESSVPSMVYVKLAAREPRLAQAALGRDLGSRTGGAARLPASFFQQSVDGGQAQEDDGGTEHPARLAVVHQPTKEE